MKPDPLAAERHGFIAAVTAATAAAGDAARLIRANHGTEVDVRDVLEAVRDLAEKQTAALAALDRFFQRGNELGFARATVADLREGRAGLATTLGMVLCEVERLEHLLGASAAGRIDGGGQPDGSSEIW